MYNYSSFSLFFRTAILLSILLGESQLGIGQSRRPTSGDFSRGNAGVVETVTDTLDRPPLLYTSLSLSDMTTVTQNIDTSLNTVHIVEPYYMDRFLLSNLGSENSARFSSVFDLPEQPIRLDNPSYNRIFKQTSEESLVRVNRSFIQFHYGQGERIKSNNLSVRFYRPFARNLNFNFAYNSFSDNGMHSNQTNSFGRLDLKLSQASKSGNRFTYFHYDQPKIEENVATSADASTILINSSVRSFVLGNKIIIRDSVNAPIKATWITKLEFKSRNFSSIGSSLDSISNKLVLLDGGSLNNLSYKNSLSEITLKNKYQMKYFGGDLSFGLDLSAFSHTLGDSSFYTKSYFVSLLKIKYFKKIGDKLSLSQEGSLGLFDSAGATNFRAGADIAIADNWHIKASLTSNRSLQSLERELLVVNDSLFQNQQWDKLTQNSFVVEVANRKTKTKAEFGLSSSSNMLVVNRSGLYEQMADRINFSYAELFQDFNIGPIQTSHALKVQSVSTNRIALPDLSYSGKLYFNLWMFKKKMYTQFGADLYFIPSFDTPEYYPVTGDFYNTDFSTQSNNVLIVNPYFNAKVGPFLFFIKGLHSSYLLFPTNNRNLNESRFNYKLTSDFSGFEYRMKFGFKWTLLD